MKIFAVFTAIALQSSVVAAQDCVEYARELARVFDVAKVEAKIHSFEIHEIDAVDPVHGRLRDYRYDDASIRFAVPQCRFVKYFNIKAKPKICVAVEKTDGKRRVIPKEERIERCVSISIDTAEHTAVELFESLTGGSFIGSMGLKFRGTELQGCGGGFCHLSRWGIEKYVDDVRIAGSSLLVWTNAESGDVFSCTFIEIMPARDGIITSEDAKSMALASLTSESDCQVEKVALAQYFDSSGAPQRFWVTNVVCAKMQESAVVFVDALDGRVVSEKAFYADLSSSKTSSGRSKGEKPQ